MSQGVALRSPSFSPDFSPDFSLLSLGTPSTNMGNTMDEMLALYRQSALPVELDDGTLIVINLYKGSPISPTEIELKATRDGEILDLETYVPIEKLNDAVVLQTKQSDKARDFGQQMLDRLERLRSHQNNSSHGFSKLKARLNDQEGFDEYVRGMTNGLRLALHIMEGKSGSPDYL